MKVPRLEYSSKIDIPDGLEATFRKTTDHFELLTSALIQPKIRVYPKVDVIGDYWLFQIGSSLMEIEGDTHRVIKCDTNQCNKAWGVHYVKVGSEIERIYFLNNKYVFKNDEYETLISYFGTTCLMNKGKGIIFKNGKIFDFEDLKLIGTSRAGLSLIREGETTLLGWDNSVQKFKIEGIILYHNINDIIFKDPEDKLVINDRTIGTCKENADVIAGGHGWYLISCGNLVRQYFWDGWRSVRTGIYPTKSDGSENYVALVSEGKTEIFDNNFKLLYELKPATVGVGRRKVVIYRKKTVSIIDLSDLLEVKIEENRPENIISIRVPEGYVIETDKFLPKVSSRKVNGYVVEQFEYLGNYPRMSFNLLSEFISSEIPISLNEEPIILRFKGNLLVADSFGRTKDNNGNAILSGELLINRNIRSEAVLRISLDSLHKEIKAKFSDKRFVFNESLRVPAWEKSHKEIRFSLFVNDMEISSLQALVPVVKIEKPKETKKLFIDKGHIFLEILRSEDKNFIFDTVKVHPKYKQPVEIIVNSVLDNSKKSRVRFDYKYSNNTVVMRMFLYKLIRNPKIWIEGNYLNVDPNISLSVPVQIFYGTSAYFGLPIRVLFPFDPIYDLIVIRVFVGNTEIEERYRIDSLNLGFIIANASSMKIKEVTESVGVL
ncbi:hypothetical protein GWK48_04190 [Metallosphaera tengchongensis]|uniref:Uncharacterized protein n=1 Tax=Metallosphaera tengchongensis TaxID=1532350 RepID=A0A6N0NU92_9CREN|nr:hypothetical protein [Metallosphaera tengchongensis]QKQ99696.1 hypothetical protein GWK48_04190 [Metallosphaera tengchongensis]